MRQQKACAHPRCYAVEERELKPSKKAEVISRAIFSFEFTTCVNEDLQQVFGGTEKKLGERLERKTLCLFVLFTRVRLFGQTFVFFPVIIIFFNAH